MLKELSDFACKFLLCIILAQGKIYAQLIGGCIPVMSSTSELLKIQTRFCIISILGSSRMLGTPSTFLKSTSEVFFLATDAHFTSRNADFLAWHVICNAVAETSETETL